MKKTKTLEWVPKKVLVKNVKKTALNFKIKTELGKQRLQESLSKFGLAGTAVCDQNLNLIDGNSRLEEAVEKGWKYMWVSVPNRAMTKSEYTEMSAMFDFAKAGDVDVDRISGELGTSKDFFERWGMEPPLGFGDKAVSLASLKYPEEGEGSKSKKENSTLLESDIRPVTLFFSLAQRTQWDKWVEKGQKKFKTDNITDFVFKAIKSIKL